MEKRYLQFVNELREMLLAATGYTEEKVYFKKGDFSPEEDRLFIEHIRKGNMCQLCGLRPRELFEHYCAGASMEGMVQSALASMQYMKLSNSFDAILNMENYSAVENELFIRLLNYERNKQELSDAIYRRYGDIAMVLYLKLSDLEGCLSSVKIRKYVLKTWGLDEKEVFDKALLNTYFMSPPRIFYWEKMMFHPEYCGENFMNLCENFPLKKNFMGNCLSTALKTNGAVAVFLPGVAQRIAQLLEHDFYIAFTSIHEAMIHRDDTVDVETLKDILRETIEEATPEDEFLSYSIYHYESETGQFTYE